MRINLYLTPSSTASKKSTRCTTSVTSSSTGPTSSASPQTVLPSITSTIPAPLLALSPNGELILIELQGSLEMEGLDFTSGSQVVGEFTWKDGKEEKPTLLLSHHRLEGTLTTLARPLAVLEKRKRRNNNSNNRRQKLEDGGRVETSDGAGPSRTLGEDDERPTQHEPSSPPLMSGISNNPLLQNSDDEDLDTSGYGSRIGAKDRGRGSVSPTIMQRRRKHLEEGSVGNVRGRGNESISSLGPLQKKSKTSTSQTATTTTTPARPVEQGRRGRDGPSSSPAPLPPMRGSLLDFSSPQPRPSRRGQGNVDILSSSPIQSSALRAAEDHIDQEEEEGGSHEEGRTTPSQQRHTAHTRQLPVTTTTAVTTSSTTTTSIEEEMSGARPAGTQTSTYYQVMCIVRKKVLFSKRPEPVVHGLGGRSASASTNTSTSTSITSGSAKVEVK